MTEKTLSVRCKYRIFKVLGVLIDIFILFLFTSLVVILNIEKSWESIDTGKISDFYQWLTLVIYRLCVYLLPGIALSLFPFDRRYNYLSRLKMSINWTLCIYLISNAIIRVFAIDKVLGITIFENIDLVVLLTGYIFTLSTKKMVEFDSTIAVVDPKQV